MNWDFDSVHIVRGKKAKNTELWPNLATDTSPDALLTPLKDKVDEGRKLYVATNERETSLFDPLKDKYETHFVDEFKDLWGEESEWVMKRFRASLNHKNVGQTKFIKTELTKIRYKIKQCVSIGSIHREQG